MTRFVYHDVPGEYVALRYKVDGEASFEHDSFLFVTCVGGSGTVCGEAISLGETLFIPVGYGRWSFPERWTASRSAITKRRSAPNEKGDDHRRRSHRSRDIRRAVFL